MYGGGKLPFGLPHVALLDRVKEIGAKVLYLATTTDEAV